MFVPPSPTQSHQRRTNRRIYRKQYLPHPLDQERIYNDLHESLPCLADLLGRVYVVSIWISLCFVCLHSSIWFDTEITATGLYLPNELYPKSHKTQVFGYHWSVIVVPVNQY